MQRFKSARQAQRFLSAYAFIYGAFSSATPSDEGESLSLRTGDRFHGLERGDLRPRRSSMMQPARYSQPKLDRSRLS
jgi:hypothetical protein